MLTSTKNYIHRPPHSTFEAEELDGNIVDRLSRVVNRCPDHAAVCHKGETISYRELDVRSNQLASFLLTKMGTGREPVALMFTHGAEHLICQLAILKAGKFYSNVDTNLPTQQQARILSNLGGAYLIHDNSSKQKMAELADQVATLTFVNIKSVVLAEYSSSPPTITISAEDQALIVYTSGSTGPPQGVVLTHQYILHLSRANGSDIGLGNADRTTQICAHWTGASSAEIYCTLLNEGTLYPYSPQKEGVLNFARLLADASITTMVAAPVLFRSLLQSVPTTQKFPAMRVIRLGGDRISQHDVAILRKHFSRNCRLRISYGSSEFIPVSRLYIDRDYQVPDRASVGYAIEGCEISIVDEEGKLLRPGEVGEIVVTSKYLSPGYWRSPQLSIERFKNDSDTGRRYFTRDLGFKDAEGCLYHIGRIDARVKVYGKLVLLTDIEQAILRVPGVTSAALIPFANDESKNFELAAFVTVSSIALDKVYIRKELLKAVLPEFVPRKLIILAELPMLSSAKVDRQKLRQLVEASIW